MGCGAHILSKRYREALWCGTAVPHQGASFCMERTAIQPPGSLEQEIVKDSRREEMSPGGRLLAKMGYTDREA